MDLNKVKIALVFDWMTNTGGAEKVNYILHEIFPNADIFTSIYDEKALPEFKNANIKTSFIQKIPLAKSKHQLFLSLMPYAYELFNLNDYDIVISSSHSCSKGVITKPETLHISYCHSPMRYAWDNWHNYVHEYKMNWLFKFFGKIALHKIRMWDFLSSKRVDHFIANSNTSKKRIQKYYNRKSDVVYPSINTQNFKNEKSEDYFLAIGRLTSYKKFDLIVDAFNKSGHKIKIAGTGIQFEELKKKAKDNIEMLGFVSDEELKNLYSKSKALIFPQLEDFGITPLEAMASGKPIIAYKKGGALDSIKENLTGIFFEEQSIESLNAGVEKFLENESKFKTDEIINHAKKFDNKVFKEEILKIVKEKWAEHSKKYE